jgi:tetratricopeptide (TPR) repeat protein
MNNHRALLVAIIVSLCSNVLFQNLSAQVNETKDSLKVTGFFDISNRYLDINTDTARIFARKGIDMSQKLKYERGKGKGYFYIALSYDIDNEYDSSIVYYHKSLMIYQKINAAKSCAVTLSNLGKIYLKKGNVGEAFKAYNDALPFFESINHKEGIGRTYFNIGVVFKSTGNYEAAIDHFFKALTISELIKDTLKTTTTLKEIGNVYFRQRKYDKAIYYYSKALGILEKKPATQDKSNIAGLKCCLGASYADSGNFGRAAKNYNQAYFIYEMVHDKAGMANVLLNIGELNNKQKKYKEALMYNARSLEISKRHNDTYSIAYALYTRGSIYRGMDLYSQALIMLNDAMVRAEKLKDKYLMGLIMQEMSVVYDTLMDYKNAYKYFKLHKAIEDSLSNDEVTRKITTMELQYSFDKKQKTLKFAQEQKEILYKAQLKRQRLIVKALIITSILLTLLVFTGFAYYSAREKAKLHALETELNKNIQQTLSQQMNPHFIFNCLNSIKALIMENRNDETEIYFGVFTNLMRKNLEYSQSPVISIKDEVDALKLYVELEKLRFKDKFTFRTNIDEDIDIYNYKIPSLLLQPFVENAILHGIRNKESHGNISLELRLNESEIQCFIDDDGVGRGQGQNTTASNHKSYGMALTKKRLELIFQLYGKAKGLTIIDKKDQQGIPEGTRIEFGIPIIV